MTSAAKVLCAGFAIYLAFVMVAHVNRKRRLAKVRAGRETGAEAFAASMGRAMDDAVVRATYAALVSEGGNELDRVRGDDDLGRLYGIVEEDFDELVTVAARALNAEAGLPDYVRAKSPKGRPLNLKTPSQIVQFLDGLVEWTGPAAAE